MARRLATSLRSVFCLSSAQAAIAVLCAVMSVVALTMIWPRAHPAGALLLARDDPAALADARLETMPADAGTFEREVEQALSANDVGLAQSFCDLAAARGFAISPQAAARVAARAKHDASAGHIAAQFANGLVRGETSDLASLSGTVTGDLFVFGDIRDVVRESGRLVRGEEPDRLVLGLATAGIAVTAATYVSLAGAAPVRAGLTLVKDARKAGRLGAGLASWTEHAARDMVDASELEQAAASAAALRPAATLDAVRTAFRVDKAGEVLRTAKDVGRLGERAGVRGALDGLRIAEGPGDVARAARLAEAKGSQTRAILKLFGRGALVLAAGAFDLSLWVFGAALALLSFLCSIKAAAERLGMAWSKWARRRTQARRAGAGRPAAMPAAQVAVPGQIL